MDFRANIGELYEIKHPAVMGVIAMADRENIYNDFGQLAAIAWVATDQKNYLDEAAKKIAAKLEIEPLPNANTIREHFAELAMLYGWLKHSLVQSQRDDIEKRLWRWCEFCFAIDMPKQYQGGWRYEDSDQTLGQLFGITICDDVCGWNWSTRDAAKVARDKVLGWIDCLAEGEWIESRDYDLGTLQLLLVGAYAAENQQYAVKLAPHLSAIVEAQLAAMTPDGAASYQWGDTGEPRSLQAHRRLSLWGMLIGLTGDDRLQAALGSLLKTANTAWERQANLAYRACFFYKPETNRYLHGSARGNGSGIFSYVRDSSAVYVHAPRRLDVDHEVAYACDIGWYLDGEWILTRPLGYGGPADNPYLSASGEAANAPLFAGLSSMRSRGPTWQEERSDGFSVCLGTAGPHYGTPYYQPPGKFVDSFLRVIQYEHASRLTVIDTFQGKRPADVARYRKPDQALINAAPLWQVVAHCPTKPTETPVGFTWKTAKGKTVNLTAPANCVRKVIDEAALWGNLKAVFKPSELKWQIRFCSDAPTWVATTIFEVSK